MALDDTSLGDTPLGDDTPTSAPLPATDAMSNVASEALRAFAQARAAREAAVETGAEILLRQLPEQDHLETLHLILSDDAPIDVQMIFYAPKGLTSETWDALIGTSEKRWTKMEEAVVVHNQPLTAFDPADVLAFNTGMEAMVLHVAATMGLDVRAVSQRAWGQTYWKL